MRPLRRLSNSFAGFTALCALRWGAACTSDSAGADTGKGGAGAREGTGGTMAAGGGADASTADASPPKQGAPGCGFAAAAFCDTFDGPSQFRGRGGELSARFWSAGRMEGQLSTTRAIGIGMAVIPPCRSGVSNHVWPDGDTLVCDPSADVESPHLLVAVAAQNYGQNGYRIRQPFDFAGRTGKVAFDAAVDPLGPLFGWVSFAVTEDPMTMPGYSIQGNDEGSIIPRNGVEVHFVNAPGSTGDEMSMRNVHVFDDYVDTVYAPTELPRVSYQAGKMNHYEFLVSENGVDVSVTPWSEDGRSFAAPAFTYHADAHVPFSRGYVHVSVHNHATIKYSHDDRGFSHTVDASVALVDNVGFDGPVLGGFREYEVPDSLVRFTDPMLGDPDNPDGVGYDIGYFVEDAAQGPKQVLEVPDVDVAGATAAKLAFSAWVDAHGGGAMPEQFAFRVRLNGKSWHGRKLSPEEASMLIDGPKTVDPTGAPMGNPASQGRLAIIMDVPVDDLVPGKNTVEFVTANVPTSYPPIVCNVDLVLGTK